MEEHPRGNGLAENFMIMLRKVAHVAIVKNCEEVQKYLLNYRAMPHSSTGKSPAKLLFNRPTEPQSEIFNREKRLF